MNKVKIYYGSKKWFDKNRPSTYRNLTEVVNELDEQKRKNIMFIANMPKNNESDKMVEDITKKPSADILVVMVSSDEEHDCIAAEKKENKQLKRIMEFADNNNLIPMKVFRRGIFGRRLSDEMFYKAIRYMRAGKADALIVANLDAISDGIADSYLKIGVVREAGFRLFSVDEKEPKVDLYIPPKRGDLQ